MSSGGPTSFDDVLPDLARFIRALGDYREVTILAGGFVPFFYRRMPNFTPLSLPPLLTSDIDWALPTQLDVLGGRRLSDRLEDLDLVTIHSRDTEPPVQRYQHKRFGNENLGPVYGEFLVPLVGSAVDRRGSPRTVQTMQDGLTAQALRYLDLLFEFPIEFDASAVLELGLTGPHVIRVPHPATYVLQKLLARPSREPAKRDKDLAYIYEVALLTRERWHEVATVLEQLKNRSYEYETWLQKARQQFGTLFRDVASEGPIAVARTYRGLSGAGWLPSELAVWTVLNGFSRDAGF